MLSTLLAQVQNPVVVGGDRDGVTYITAFIPRMVTLVVIIGGLFFFFMLIIGGLRWVMSGGDKGQVESARSQITHALIGLVILFSSWAVAKLIESIFGVNIINVDLTPILAK